MSGFEQFQSAVTAAEINPILIIGVLTGIAFFTGKLTKYVKLPSIIGFMLIGVLLGPSLFNVLGESLQENLEFITEISLGFVALSIGFELKFSILKRQGFGILLIILLESFGAFALVSTAVYLLTGDLPLALIFGGIAPASAPAGTVAVIQEYKARGPLTEALFAVVGFDDGLGIIIFGFAAAIARNIILSSTGADMNFWGQILIPLKEIFLSLVIGSLAAFLMGFLMKAVKDNVGLFIVTFALVLTVTGLCEYLGLSLILTNMAVGIILVNTQSNVTIEKIKGELTNVMPLLFILFFAIAGANLHISALPALGLLGMVYIFARSAGLIGGSKLGAILGRSDENIRKYLGLGILSQAGVAIGLALIVKHEFSELGTWGSEIGATVITTITATCLFFEIIGPILTKIGLKKAGEIQV